MKNIGKPCAGKPHARFDEGGQGETCSLLYRNPIKNPEDLNDDQMARLDAAVKGHCHKSIETYTHKLNLQNIYLSEGREMAEGLMTHWLKATSESAILQVRKFSKTVNDHLDGIMNYFDSGLTSGFIEGLNSIIQSAKAKARGYRNAGC